MRILVLLLTSYDVMLFCFHLSETYEYYNDREMAVAVALAQSARRLTTVEIARYLPHTTSTNYLFSKSENRLASQEGLCSMK